MRLVTGYAASSQAKTQPLCPIAVAGDFVLKEEDFPPLRPSAKAAAAQVATKTPSITPSPSNPISLPHLSPAGPKCSTGCYLNMVLSGSDKFQAENLKKAQNLFKE
jgi:hypothetical protein